MRRFMVILGWVAAMACWTAPSSAADAPDVPAGDARDVRAVIQAQFEAFAADDAKRAFSFATPKLREVFGNADDFIELVRSAYPVVYRHATVAFLKPERVDRALLQGVHLTDAQGVLWLAMYRMERQRDRSWRIGACQMVPTRGQVA